MKKQVFLTAVLMGALGSTQAQEVIKTYESCDADLNGSVTVADATKVVNRVLTEAPSTPMVTAEQLNAVLQEINAKLEKLELLQKQVNALTQLDVAIAGKLDVEIPEDLRPDSNNGHEYVDLGITDANGKTIYWATCNVGATSPEEYGDYFAWGETSTKSDYDWSTYTYCQGTDNTLTKYCTSSDFGTVDNKTVLEPEDDAATVHWGGTWRMPTYAEQTQLRTECYWEWVTSYNGKSVKGYVVYKAKAAADKGKYSYNNPTLSATYSVSNDAHIFLPAAGYLSGSDLNYAGSEGSYWSSSLNSSTSDDAYCLDFSSSYVNWLNFDRYYGRSVRPVCQ